ncbi:MAG TPA: PA-phosphatase, partial [Catalimonadaceae bacterium]|nr:PA-phosphatase [Catalimonadaceae bacterium]
MKSARIVLSIIVLSIWGITGCEREIISRNSEFEALNPANSDTGARFWKPVLLVSPDEFPVATPIAVTSPDYKLEMLEIKSWQNKMTQTERDQMKYWSAGVVLRWNEIMRELVAKYNLPPYENADGSYPIPNSANPLA